MIFLRFLFLCIIISFASRTCYSDDNLPRQILLLGSILNRTDIKKCDTLDIELNRLISGNSSFPEIVFKPEIIVDSFPDENTLLTARDLNASYILWGTIDNSAYGFNVTLKILEMSLASVAHIQIFANKDENMVTISEMLLSKLLLWLRRTTMIQLIITTDPKPVDVILDGKEIGTTPFESMIQPGTYKLELHKKNYHPIRIPVSFISGNTYQYDFSLSPIDKNINKRSQIKWLSIPLTFLGAGIIANLQKANVYEKYHSAKPPADFDNLYRKANNWNICRNIMFSAAGLSFSVIVIKVIF